LHGQDSSQRTTLRFENAALLEETSKARSCHDGISRDRQTDTEQPVFFEHTTRPPPNIVSVPLGRNDMAGSAWACNLFLSESWMIY